MVHSAMKVIEKLEGLLSKRRGTRIRSSALTEAAGKQSSKQKEKKSAIIGRLRLLVERYRGKRSLTLGGLAALALLVAIISLGVWHVGSERVTVPDTALAGKDALSAEDGERSSSESGTNEPTLLVTGISGIMNSVEDAEHPDSAQTHFGTSAETMLFGQRVSKKSRENSDTSLRSCLESGVLEFRSALNAMPQNASLMSDYDYENLCQIVEAEASTEDLKGRILVANVIMNRVRSPEFPNSVSDVVYQYENGVAQFSPVEDGRIYSVTISELTLQAVRQVLEGVDYSNGALFFIQRDIADPDSTGWFDAHLKYLFQYGVHEFYTYRAK